MSLKERDRIRVLEQRQGGQLSQKQAAAQLGVCARQMRRIEGRYAEQGDVGLVHQGRGRASNRRVSAALQERAVACLQQPDWRDFGPTFAAEKLAEREGIVVGRETVRRWMTEAGLWQPRSRGVTHRSWRQRRECCGELVQMDSSIHDWFEGRGAPAVLIQMVDDATGTKFARFFTTDSTATNMTMLRDYIQRYGRPLALYTDKASHFVTTRSASVEEELEDRQAETQIARALRELGIEQILAHSPQAKGRIERAFATDQDRLVKDLRLHRISTLEEANAHLERAYLPEHNARFAVKPACAADAHRAAEGYDLDAILSHQESRVVTSDYTVQYRSQRYQIARQSAKAGLRGSRVIVEQRLDGSVRLRRGDDYLQARVLPEPPARQAEAAPTKRAATPRVGHVPAADHPWREAARRDARLRAARQTRPGTTPPSPTPAS